MKPKISLRVIAWLVVRFLEKIFWAMFVLGLGFIEFNWVLKSKLFDRIQLIFSRSCI